MEKHNSLNIENNTLNNMVFDYDNFKKNQTPVNNITKADILEEINITTNRLKQGQTHPPNKSEKPAAKETHLNFLNDVEQRLKELSSNDIVFSTPLITRFNVPIIRRGTINVIQGKFGSHKSRLAELFLSLMLSNHQSKIFLGFKKNVTEQFTVGLIDTERNIKEELPFAIQNIKIKAGFDKKNTVPSFRYTSLKHIYRQERLPALKEWINSLRESTEQHLFILLDVVTDCVSSFNKDDEAMRLFDFLGKLCDDTDTTFLLIIHENPGTEKARGHIGTESANKASTVIQIGFVGNKNREQDDLIRLKFIKLRSAKKPDNFYLIYSPESKGLVEAPPEMVQELVGDGTIKARIDKIIQILPNILNEPRPQKEILEILCEEFDASEKTIKRRLKEIEGIDVGDGRIFKVDAQRGKPTILKLEMSKTSLQVKTSQKNEHLFSSSKNTTKDK